MNQSKQRQREEVLEALENSPLPSQLQSDLCDTAALIRFENLSGAPNCPHEAFRAGWCASLAVQAAIEARAALSQPHPHGG